MKSVNYFLESDAFDLDTKDRAYEILHKVGEYPTAKDLAHIQDDEEFLLFVQILEIDPEVQADAVSRIREATSLINQTRVFWSSKKTDKDMLFAARDFANAFTSRFDDDGNEISGWKERYSMALEFLRDRILENNR